METDLMTSTPHAVSEAATLGPWTITVDQVVSGAEAASLMAETNAKNPEPMQGLGWLCVQITVQNTSQENRPIQMVDFGVTSSDGVIRRTNAWVVPDPMLQAVVKPGESFQGWIAAQVADPATALLLFSSPLLGGNWAEGVFALAEGATLPDLSGLDPTSTDVGSEPAAAVGFGETVTVGGWEVTVSDPMMGGDAIYELFDFQTKALGEPDPNNNEWVYNGAAVKATVRNLNPFPAFFSEIALEVCDFNGEPWDHTLTLTIPEATDVAREYMPGATGEGYVAFGGWQYTAYDLLRVGPNRITGEFRYYTFGGDPTAAAPEATAEATAEPITVAVGDIVETSEDLVNLRDAPSTSGKIIKELPLGTKLEVTADPVDADGYTWVPVTVIDGGTTGFVVGTFIKASA